MLEDAPAEPHSVATLLEPSSRNVKPAMRSRRRRIFFEWVGIIIAAVVVSFVMRTFAFQTFFIPSASMEPTLQIGDRIIVDKLSVKYGTINRGDILVFKAPPAENCGEPVTDLVKRVVGLPGDRISSKGNTIYVNGVVFQERWTHTEPLGQSITPLTVAPNNYFMMGDNHSNSCDSRMWGTVPRSYVIGKAFIRIWPLRRIGFL